MYMKVTIIPPLPPGLGSSYGQFEFRKYGVCCWSYAPDPTDSANYDGEVEFINSRFFVTEPKLPNPVGFRYWFQPGVIALVTPGIAVRADIQDVKLNSVKYNATTGKNLPMVLP